MSGDIPRVVQGAHEWGHGAQLTLRFHVSEEQVAVLEHYSCSRGCSKLNTVVHARQVFRLAASAACTALSLGSPGYPQ